jgi:hypothetical protein
MMIMKTREDERKRKSIILLEPKEERERKSIIFVRRFPGYARSSFW